MPSPLIFDCDGTLVASEPLYAAVDAHVLGAYGLPMSADDIRTTYMGVPVGKMLADMAQRFSLTFPDDILHQLDVLVQKKLDAELQAMPGIHTALDVLQQRGHPMAIATNSQVSRTVRNLHSTQLTGFFGGRIAAVDLVPHAKPSPDVYLLAAKMLGAHPKDCIAVEDSSVGMRAVLAAGMIGIGFAPADHGAHAATDLLEAGAHVIINAMSDLPDAVETAQELRELI
jgi:HAD superfamily hydrolase (TIGR01509 family)